MKKAAVRILLWGTLAGLLVGAGALAWHLRERRQIVYTDADTIHQPLEQAAPRDILWQPPVHLASSVNSRNDEYEPALSRDGMTLLFVRGRAGGEADLYESTRTADGWTEPRPLEDINTDADEIGPELSPDGTRLYFCSDRAGGEGGYDIWCARRGPDGWDAPFNLGPAVNTRHNEHGPALTPDGRLLYFASNRPAPTPEGSESTEGAAPAPAPSSEPADFDLYVAAVTDEGLSEAAPILELNSAAHEGSPAVSPFGDFLYFMSDRPGGAGGFDLYRSRRADGRHLPPTSLGAPVNTAANELDPTVDTGGFALHFSSDRPMGLEPQDGDGALDLYRSTSREVFAEVSTFRASVDWAALWAMLAPLLIWLLVLLLLLAAMIRLLQKADPGRVGLLMRCLLGSALLHALLLFLLTFWGVSSDISRWLDERGAVQVALTSAASTADLAGQVRGSMTRFEVSGAEAPASTRVEAPDEPIDAATAEALAAAPAPMPAETPLPPIEVEESRSRRAELAASPQATTVDSSDAGAVATPAAPQRVRIVESRATVEATETPTETNRLAQPADAAPPRAAERWQIETTPNSTVLATVSEQSLNETTTTESIDRSSAADQSRAGQNAAPPAAAPDSPLPMLSEVTTERMAETRLTVRATSDPLPRRQSSPVTGADRQREPTAVVVAVPPAEVADGAAFSEAPTVDSRAPRTNLPVEPAAGAPVGASEAVVSLPSLPSGERRAVQEAQALVTATTVTSGPARMPAEAPDPRGSAGAVELPTDAGNPAPAPEPLATLATGESGLPSAQSTVRPGSDTIALDRPADAESNLRVPAAAAESRQAVAERTAPAADAAAGIEAAPRATTSIEAPTDTARRESMLLASTVVAEPATARPSAGPSLAPVAQPDRTPRSVEVTTESSSSRSLPPVADTPLPRLADAGAGPAGEATLAVSEAAVTRTTARAALEGASAEEAPLLERDVAAATTSDAPFDRAIQATISESRHQEESAKTSTRTPLVAASAEQASSLDLPHLPLAAQGERNERTDDRARAAASVMLPSAPRAATAADDRPAWSAAAVLASPSSAAPAGSRSMSSTTMRDASAVASPWAVASAAGRGGLAVPRARDRQAFALPSDVRDVEAPTSAHLSPSVPKVDRTGRAPIAELPTLWAGGTRTSESAPPAVGQARVDDAQSLAEAAAAVTEDRTPRSAGHPWLLASPSSALPEPLETDLDLPVQVPLPRPYDQRSDKGRMELVETMGGSKETEKAVTMALEWLAAHQSRDGRWDGIRFDDRCGRCGGRARVDVDIALTGLSLLCFLAADHTHVKDGPFRENVAKALDWLVEQQGRRGDLLSGETLYSHGIASIALAEAYGMTQDADLAEPVRAAVDFIYEARNRTIGGWRYGPGQIGDTSVLGWQVMALASAKRSGIDPPAEAFDVADRWLRLVGDSARPGLYAYKPDRTPTPAMTAEAIFVRQLLGDPIDEAQMRRAARYILDHPPAWEEDANTYYWYYATLALFQHHGEPWQEWNEIVKQELLTHQQQSGPQAGSWNPRGQWANVGGRVYQTAMCTLTLEVYYRYLPLYLQAPPEDEAERRRSP